MSEDKQSSFLDFQNEFNTQEACEEHLSKQRQIKGLKCPKCGCDRFWYLKKRKLFDCQNCRHQASLTAGTIFHKTRVPLYKWYWLMYRMLVDEGSYREMQKILDIKKYKTVWLMAHKIHAAMDDRPEMDSLAGIIGLDESYFWQVKTEQRRERKEKSILCAVSLYSKSDVYGRNGFAYMEVVDETSRKPIVDFLERLGFDITTKEWQRVSRALEINDWISNDEVSNYGLKDCKVMLSDPKSAERVLQLAQSGDCLTNCVNPEKAKGSSGTEKLSYRFLPSKVFIE
ncbi:MAG: transposase [Nitrospirae bacterium]|nr:transposase [Nitrospirota bacterium]